MPRSIDLPRVRQALAELDRIAAEHPEIIGKGEPWADNLDELHKVITMDTNQRIAEYRARQRDKGMRRISIFLSPEASEALEALQRVYPGQPIGEIVSRSLVTTALAKVTKD